MLLKIQSVERGDGKQVALGEGGRSVIVGFSAPEAARGDVHTLFLDLAHGHQAHVLVAGAEALVLDAVLDDVTEVLGEAGAQHLVVLLAVQVACQDAFYQLLGGCSVKALLLLRLHAVCVGYLVLMLEARDADTDTRDAGQARHVGHAAVRCREAHTLLQAGHPADRRAGG